MNQAPLPSWQQWLVRASNSGARGLLWLLAAICVIFVVQFVANWADTPRDTRPDLMRHRSYGTFACQKKRDGTTVRGRVVQCAGYSSVGSGRTDWRWVCGIARAGAVTAKHHHRNTGWGIPKSYGYHGCGRAQVAISHTQK